MKHFLERYFLIHILRPTLSGNFVTTATTTMATNAVSQMFKYFAYSGHLNRKFSAKFKKTNYSVVSLFGVFYF